MRNTLSIQLTSLLIQYSLVISVTILPFCNPAIVRAQEKVLPANGPTTSLQNDATHGLGQLPVGKISAPRRVTLIRPWEGKLDSPKYRTSLKRSWVLPAQKLRTMSSNYLPTIHRPKIL